MVSQIGGIECCGGVCDVLEWSGWCSVIECCGDVCDTLVTPKLWECNAQAMSYVQVVE